MNKNNKSYREAFFSERQFSSDKWDHYFEIEDRKPYNPIKVNASRRKFVTSFHFSKIFALTINIKPIVVCCRSSISNLEHISGNHQLAGFCIK